MATIHSRAGCATGSHSMRRSLLELQARAAAPAT